MVHGGGKIEKRFYLKKKPPVRKLQNMLNLLFYFIFRKKMDILSPNFIHIINGYILIHKVSSMCFSQSIREKEK
jgi:hypothetical protein